MIGAMDRSIHFVAEQPLLVFPRGLENQYQGGPGTGQSSGSRPGSSDNQ